MTTQTVDRHARPAEAPRPVVRANTNLVKRMPALR